MEIGGLVEPGTVTLNGDRSLSFPEGVARGDVRITNGTEVNVRSNGGGSIAVNAGNVEISEGSVVRAGINSGVGIGKRPAGDIEIRATGDVSLRGGGTRKTKSQISNSVLGETIGVAGNIDIDAESLSVEDGFWIVTGIQPNAAGTAGDINIHVQDAASFDGFDKFTSGAYSLIEAGGIGSSGSVNLTAGSLSLTNGAVFRVTVVGRGTVGGIDINVRDAVIVDGAGPGLRSDFASGGLYNRVEVADSLGTVGGIQVNAGSLTVSGGAVITGSTGGRGDAGKVSLNIRNEISIFGDAPFDTVFNFAQSSGIFSSVKLRGIGEGGRIDITTGLLSVTDGGVINADTRGQGNGGNIEINAGRVYVADVDSDGQSSIILSLSEPDAKGRGGDILINADTVQLVDGGIVNTRTRSPENGGNVTINAKLFEAINGGQVISRSYAEGQAGSITVNASRISLSGRNLNYIERPINTDIITAVSPNSGLFASTESDSSGAGGTLSLSAENIRLRGGEVSVSSAGTGTAGDVTIDADSLQIDGGLLNAETNAGNGEIYIRTNDLQLRRNSRITTNARGLEPGGNIAVETEILTALENSDISANSQQSQGGRITINTQGLLGTEFREFPTPESDLTATSALGVQFNGIVDVNLEGVDATSGLLELPDVLVDVDALVDRRCLPGTSPRSEFAITGRGGIPPSPRDALSGGGGWVDANSAGAVPQRTIHPVTLPVEAQGWIVNDRGEIEWVAQMPNRRREGFESGLSSCGVGKKEL